VGELRIFKGNWFWGGGLGVRFSDSVSCELGFWGLVSRADQWFCFFGRSEGWSAGCLRGDSGAFCHSDSGFCFSV
jgi:hypothetical protein